MSRDRDPFPTTSPYTPAAYEGAFARIRELEQQLATANESLERELSLNRDMQYLADAQRKDLDTARALLMLAYYDARWLAGNNVNELSAAILKYLGPTHTDADLAWARAQIWEKK